MRFIRNSPDPEQIRKTIFEGVLSSNLPPEEKTDARLAQEAQLIVFAGEGTVGKLARCHHLFGYDADLRSQRIR